MESKRLAGEEVEPQGVQRPSTASSPAVTTQNDLPLRTGQPQTLRSNILSHSQQNNLRLEPFANPSLQYASANIQNQNELIMMSAPAHITSFQHQMAVPQNYSSSPQFTNYLDSSQPNSGVFQPQSSPESLEAKSLSQYQIPTPLSTPELGTSITDSLPMNPTWQPQHFAVDMTPTTDDFTGVFQFNASNFGDIHQAIEGSFGEFNQYSDNANFDFEAPLVSAQLDGGFPVAVQVPEDFYPDSFWTSPLLPQLSPSESHFDQGSESLPMTPSSSVAPEPYVSGELPNDAFAVNDFSVLSLPVASTVAEELSVQQSEEPLSRPSSTNSSSFTRKRGINLQPIHLTNGTATSGKNTLRLPQSAGPRAPRSPLLPMRDDTRRVSKASVRPSGQITPR